MPQYAAYNPAIASPSPVIGWYDTEAIDYPSLPANLISLTQDQWTARLANPSGWAVLGGTALVSYTPPAPTLTTAQQAAATLASKLAAGIVLTCTSTPALNATYALDATSQAQIANIGQFATSFTEFPSGAATEPYPDAAGAQHTFTVSQFVAFYKAVAALSWSLNAQAGVMVNGGTPAWPVQTVEVA